jgi:hypothetical protein
MIGFDHEPELKAKLRDIVFETRLYRRNCHIHCRIEPERNGLGRVKISVAAEYEIVNQSLEKVEYAPGWTFVDGDSPASCEVTSIVGESQPRTEYPSFEKASTEESGYLKAEATKIGIEPRSRKLRYQFMTKCVFSAPENYYHPFYFSQPTIDLTITVKAPSGWKVWVGGTNYTLDEAKWHTAGLFMTGDHIEVHWRDSKMPAKH